MCREHGLAMTVQRRVILRELISRPDHPTTDQIYEAVRERVPGISRTTVYRVLEALVRVGVAARVFHPDAVARFDPVPERHHHIVCERCGKLFDLDASSVEEVRMPKTPSGFVIHDYSINFTGVCASCRREAQSPPRARYGSDHSKKGRTKWHN